MTDKSLQNKSKSSTDIDFSQRDPAEGVDALFYQRWSPRSFNKKPIDEKSLKTIFDAARWAPSCYNDQPWRFITSNGNQDFDIFCNLLTEFNQKWASNASLLGFIVARKHFEHNGKPNQLAAFDCGAAWLAMTLQARLLGLYTHGMGGIKREEIYKAFDLDPAEYEVICGFALGYIDSANHMPDDLAEIEKPSARKPLEQIWQRGA
ncbi:MAG: nitroreductase family protein [Gammaproteobacteria bacterium]|nr:nitroreductase family protein [Gammaproteobacteria bacterium]